MNKTALVCIFFITLFSVTDSFGQSADNFYEKDGNIYYKSNLVTNIAYQKNADIIRLRHLKYYGNLIEEYFKKAGHLILPSAGLIPDNDPSVLLTTAGMQQFKPYYLGTRKPPESRIATVQKCFRTSDIDCVGYTDKHLTFFEMLGNFSFGDYFKEESIKFALDFVLKELKIPKEKIIVAVFEVFITSRCINHSKWLEHFFSD